MKSKRWLKWISLCLLVGGIVIVVFCSSKEEVPYIKVGNCVIGWVGFQNMQFNIGTRYNEDATKVLERDYRLGPLVIVRLWDE